MKQNKLSMKLIKYEVINLSSSIFVIIFGLIFPIGMALLFSFAFGGEVESKAALHTQLFITMAMMMPLATLFMGYAVNYSSELETGAIQRFKLFGFREPAIITAKLIANFIFLTVSICIYSLVLILALDISVPSVGAAFTFIIFFYVFSAILLLLGHGIATLCGRFGTTFGIIMGLYFLFMILGGNMGLDPASLPDGLRHIGMALPLYYISSGFLTFWNGGAFDFLPFILSTLGLAVISAALVALSIWLTKKGKIKQGAKPVYYD